MSQILLYCRPKLQSPIAEQTVTILSEQLSFLGHDVDITHSLNLPRLILNSYQIVHLIIEKLPMTSSEAFHFAICKALGKSTIISLLNSSKLKKSSLINFVQPDALSVSQTNHLKFYRNIVANKFVMSGFPRSEFQVKRSNFKNSAFLFPLLNSLEEAQNVNLKDVVYFDGRLLLKNQSSLQLRKQWNELQQGKKISENFHLILSDNKLNELFEEESLSVVLANPELSHTEFIDWLSFSANRGALIVLNDFQATGFSNYWTSGQNCIVVSTQNWLKNLSHVEFKSSFGPTQFKANELVESTVNDLSRLYIKLWQQKTSLLTSRSAKL